MTSGVVRRGRSGGRQFGHRCSSDGGGGGCGILNARRGVGGGHDGWREVAGISGLRVRQESGQSADERRC